MKGLNRKFYHLFFAGLLLSCSPDLNSATSQGGNFLQNSGFEQSDAKGLPRGWRIVPAYMGKGEAVVDKTSVHSGTYSLKLKPNEKNTSDAFGVFLMLNREAVKGKEITISGFVKVEGIGNNLAGILFETEKQNWLMLPKDTGGRFVPVKKTFSIAESIPEAGLLLLVSGTKGSVWFDDLVVSDKKDFAESTPKTAPKVTQQLGINLVKNSSFEERKADGLPVGWKIVPAYMGKGEATVDKTSVHSGTYSFKIKPNKKNTSDAFGVFLSLDKEAVKGQEITISGFVKVEGTGNNSAGILFETEKQNWLILPKDTGGRFVPVKQTFSVAESIPQAGLLLLVGGTKGGVWFDDLRVDATQAVALKDAFGEIDAQYGNKINTPGWQDSVFISPDGKELFFAYMPYVQNDFMDILFGRISEKDVKSRGPIRPGSRGTMIFETYKVIRNKDGTWGNPMRLNINSNYSLYSAKLSHDGTELYYAIRDYHKNYGADDIYVSKKLPDGNWGPPENLGPNINTRIRDDTPCLTADGKTLYFGRNKGEALGWEIMVSRKVDGRWSKAERLGPPINEPNPEITGNYQPFITADGNEFYFTRIQQLYVSRKQPNGTWGRPVKVFPRLDVSGHASVTADGRYLYFITAKDKESLKRSHWTAWYSERQKDGSWGTPKPVD